jgi:hypothetical protein
MKTGIIKNQEERRKKKDASAVLAPAAKRGADSKSNKKSGRARGDVPSYMSNGNFRLSIKADEANYPAAEVLVSFTASERQVHRNREAFRIHYVLTNFRYKSRCIGIDLA